MARARREQHGPARRWTLRWRLVFIAPATILYAVIIVYPMLAAFTYSFFHWTGVRRDEFAGLDNYATLFRLYPYNQQLPAAFLHTGAFFVGTMLFQVVGGLGLALLLQRVRVFKRFFQTLYALPYLMSPLIIGYMWSLILAPQFGAIYVIFKGGWLDALAHPWLGDPATALITVILVNAWQWIGGPMLIFGAALGGIPQEYHEAAWIDGAGPFRTLRSITLPLLVPAFGVITVLTFVSVFNTFDIVWAMTGQDGGPAGATDVLALLFYRLAFGGLGSAPPANSIGLSNALAIMLFVFIFGVSYLIYRVLRSREVDLT